MYTMGQISIWSLPHLKAGCWYIDCGKIYCPIQEEDVRKTCEAADSKGASKGAPTGTNNAQEHEDEVEVDINLLPAKEKNKIIKQRERDIQKAKDKEEREAQKAKDKEDREAKKAKDKEDREAKKGEKGSGCPQFSTFLDRGFHYNTVTESPQVGCLRCTALNVKTAADHITGPYGLCRGGFACSEVPLL
jgi:hypothetical protein